MVLQKNGLPLYYQVENYMRDKIVKGEWPGGTQIPTEVQLMELFGVSRATLRQAISDLCNDGFLNRVQGKGTFVTENSGYGNDPTEIWEHNLPGTSHRILSCVEKDGLTKKSALLKMDASETFTVFSYLHCVKARNDEPYNLCVSYFPKSRFPQIEKHLFADTVYATLRDIYYVTIAYAESEFHIVNLSKEKADYLGVKTNSPCIRIEKVYYDRLNQPIFCTYMYAHPANSTLRIRTEFH